jgi:hypothetical protein
MATEDVCMCVCPARKQIYKLSVYVCATNSTVRVCVCVCMCVCPARKLDLDFAAGGARKRNYTQKQNPATTKEAETTCE